MDLSKYEPWHGNMTNPAYSFSVNKGSTYSFLSCNNPETEMSNRKSITDMGHHEHSHASHIDGNLNKTFIIAICLNLAFVAVEATIGWVQGALALLSDAGHNLLDVCSHCSHSVFLQKRRPNTSLTEERKPLFLFLYLMQSCFSEP